MISAFSQEGLGANCLRSFKDFEWIVPGLVSMQEQRPLLIVGVPKGKREVENIDLEQCLSLGDPPKWYIWLSRDYYYHLLSVC